MELRVIINDSLSVSLSRSLAARAQCPFTFRNVKDADLGKMFRGRESAEAECDVERNQERRASRLLVLGCVLVWSKIKAKEKGSDRLF